MWPPKVEWYGRTVDLIKVAVYMCFNVLVEG